MRYLISRKQNNIKCDICAAKQAAIEIKKLEAQLQKAKDENKERYEKMDMYLKKFWSIEKQEKFRMWSTFPDADTLKALARIGVRPCNPLSNVPYNTIDVREYAALVRNILQFKTGERYGILVFGHKASCLHEETLFFGVAPELTIRKHSDLQHVYDQKKETLDEDLKGQFSFLTSTRVSSASPGNDNFPNLLVTIKGPTPRTLSFQSHTKFVTSYIYCDDLQRNFSDKTSSCESDYLAKVLLSIAIYKRKNGIIDFTQEQYDEILTSLFYETADIKTQANGLTPKKLFLK